MAVTTNNLITGIVGSTVTAGGSNSTAKLGGVLHLNTTAVTTTGTAEELLMSYSLPANVLNATGKIIRITALWSHAANTNTALGILRLGGTGVNGTSIISQTSAVSGALYEAQAWIIRTGANTQDFFARGTRGSSVTAGTSGTDTQTETAAILICVTGTSGTQAGDISAEMLLVEVLN